MEISCPNCQDSTEFNNEVDIQICNSCHSKFELVSVKEKEVKYFVRKKILFEALMINNSGMVHSLKDENKKNLQGRINIWLKDDWKIKTIRMKEVPTVELA